MKFMKQAIILAKKAKAHEDVPIGAVIVRDGVIISRGENQVQLRKNPTLHAEIIAINRACKKLGTKFLDGCDIYVSLEPCAMCATAISWGQLDKVYFGAYDPKSGAVEHGPHIYECATCHHKPEVYGGICEKECSKLMKDFYKGLRAK